MLLLKGHCNNPFTLSSSTEAATQKVLGMYEEELNRLASGLELEVQGLGYLFSPGTESLAGTIIPLLNSPPISWPSIEECPNPCSPLT